MTIKFTTALFSSYERDWRKATGFLLRAVTNGYGLSQENQNLYHQSSARFSEKRGYER